MNAVPKANGGDIMNVPSRSFAPRIATCLMLCSAMFLRLSSPAVSQELEIRRWNHLPIDRNFATANFAHTSGNIAFDPVLQIDDAVVDLDTWLFGYIRTFELLDRTARIEVRQAWKEGT